MNLHHGHTISWELCLMSMDLPQRCIIQGVGGYLPERVITNAELSTQYNLNTSNEWIQERTGILQRHKAKESETTADLAIISAQLALADAHLNAEDLDLIVVATSTPERMFPSTATIVLNALNAKNAMAFDLNAACSGFLFALIMAQSYLMQSGKSHALVIGSESMTRLLDWSDRGTAILFGDGAGAVVVSRIPYQQTSLDRGILGHCLFSDGKEGKALNDLHVTKSSPEHPLGIIKMNGQSVFREAIAQLISCTKTLLQQENISLEDVDWIIPHQANKRILDHIRKELHIPEEKMIYVGDMHANTSAASIPLTWWKARQDGRIQPGQLLLIQAFGAGFTWGACLVRA